MGFFKSKMPLFLVLLFLFLSSALALRNLNPRDPERQFEQCRRQCQRQGRRGESQQWQCQRRCQEEYQKRGRGVIYGYGDIDAVYGGEEEDDNQGRYSHRECERRCERQGGQRWECQMRCQQEEMDNNKGRWDPQECQQRCQRQGRGTECHKRCQDEYRRGRRDGEEVDDNDMEMENPHRDPQERSLECQKRCQRQRGGQQQECQMRCQEEFEKERHRGGGRRDEDDVDYSHKDPQERFHECQLRCQRQRGGQQQECQRRCQEEFEKERHRGGGRRDDVQEIEVDDNEENEENPREDPHECMRRCQRQRGQGQQWECQRSCQEKESQRGSRHPPDNALASILELTAGLFN